MLMNLDHLATLCRIWGALELRHPRLAMNDPRWDAVLCSAVRHVLDGASLAEAVRHLIRPLNAPCTPVMHSWPDVEPVGDIDGVALVVAREFQDYWTQDGALADAIKATGDMPLLLDMRRANHHLPPVRALAQ